MAEVDNLLDFGSPTTEDQSQKVAEPSTGNLLDFDNFDGQTMESQSALPDSLTGAAEATQQAEETVESEEQNKPDGSELLADISEPVEEASSAQSPVEPPESGSEQQQQQQQQQEEEQPIVELDSPTHSDTRDMSEHQLEPQQHDDAGAAIDFSAIQSADGHSVAHADADEVQVDAGADPQPSGFDNRQYEVESVGGGVARAVPVLVGSEPDAQPDVPVSEPLQAQQPKQWKPSTDSLNPYFSGVNIGSPGDVCRICQKKVYPMELLTSDGHVYHKSCYRCHKCNRLLSVGNFGVLDNQLYCQPHYLEIFRIRGHYQAASDRPAAEVVGKDNPVDDGLSQVQKLSDLKSRFESAGGDSSVVVSPPARSPPPSASNGGHSSAEVVRSGEAVLAEGELPPPGASKNVLAMFRNLEMGGQQQQPAKEEQSRNQLPARQKGRPVSAAAALDRRASVPVQKMQQQSTTALTNKPIISQQPGQLAEQAEPVANGIVRESDSNDILPQQGTAKALLSVWRNKEFQMQQTQQQQEQLELLQQRRRSLAIERSPSASSLSASSQRSPVYRQSSHSQDLRRPDFEARIPGPAAAVSAHQRRPYQPEPNMDFDYTAPVSNAAESESRPAERPPDVVRSGDPDPADELPPANFTRSALQMWKDKELQAGRVAPNPETSERLRQRARENTGVNNNIRLPGAATVHSSGSGDAPDRAATPPQARDESSENEPAALSPDVARWDASAGGDELPKQGTTQNLRSMFSGGQ